MTWSVRLLVYSLFLVSGATALVYQVSWTRNLSLIFGASHQAISIVLASFMAGLALGGFYFGRHTHARVRPLFLYGLLEVGVAVCALLLPLLLWLIDRMYVSTALRIDGVNWTLTAVRVAMAFVALVLPTFFMGGTLPVLTRFLVQRYGQFGVRVASLYGINTLGAVFGVVLAAFFLLPALGVWRTQLVAVSANVLIGLVTFFADRRLATAPQRRAAADAKPAVKRKTPARRKSKRREPPLERPAAPQAAPKHIWALRLTFWGTAVSGLSALGLEVMWSRGISICSGTTVYSFAVMLAAFLVGIALGSWLHAAFPLRRVHESLQFGVVLIGAGLSSIVVTQSIPRLPELAVEWNLRLYGSQPAVGPTTTLLMAFAIMLVPCVFMGIAFPLAGQANARLQKSFGQSIGDTVGVNTLAAIAGSLLAGFVLIPTVGLQRGMLILSALYVAYGVVVLTALSGSLNRRRRWSAWAAGGAVLVLTCALPFVAPRWDIHVLGTFRNNNILGYVSGQGDNVVRQELDRTMLLHYEEGRGSTVSVYELGDRRSLVVDGKSVAGDLLSDLHHELLLGHLPVLLHPDPRSAIVIGLGAGITLGGVAAHESLDRIDLVEIEGAVFESAEFFADIHEDATHDSRLRIFEQDGRNFLLTTRDRYDVITADPIHPWAQGAAYLYTTEYYRMLQERLNEGGIMCQWFPLYDLSDRDLKSIAASFVENFEYNTLWHTAFDAILIGSNAPIQIDPADFSRRLEHPRVARQLARIGLETPLALLAEFSMDDANVRRFAAGGVVNTDDNLHIEFSSPLSLRSYNWLTNVQLVHSYHVSPEMILQNSAGFFASKAIAAQTLDAYMRAKAEVLNAAILTYSGGQEGARVAATGMRRILEVLPEYGLARRFYCHAQVSVAASELGGGNLESALTATQSALDACPDDAEGQRVRGMALMTLGRLDEAVQHYRESLALRPRHTLTRGTLSTLLVNLGEYEESLRVLQEGHSLYPESVEMATRLSWRLATAPDSSLRDGARALALARAALQRPIPERRRANTIAALAAAQAEVGQFDAAIPNLRKALRLAERHGQQGLIQVLLDCLSAFEAGEPMRQGAIDTRPS